MDPRRHNRIIIAELVTAWGKEVISDQVDLSRDLFLTNDDGQDDKDTSTDNEAPLHVLPPHLAPDA